MIAAMSSDEVKEAFRQAELLPDEDGGSVFGWSSPWPWNPETDCEILEETEDEAVILYYAWVSDPHVTVWRETLTYHEEENGCVVDEETLEMMNYICTGEEYARAYPHGINSTPMDYLGSGKDKGFEDGIGKALNDNALENPQNGFYQILFRPETAAICLLNFLDNPDKVSVFVEDVEQEDGSTVLSVAFAEDGSTLSVRMIQPYGEDGIWIPQDYLVNREPLLKEAAGQEE